MNWTDKLKEKWHIKSTGQVIMILIVFALTGSTVLLIKRPIVAFFSSDGEQSTAFSVLYWVFIFPTYNIILLTYGAILGQFEFFWNYEKKVIGRFRRKKNKDQSE